jgi:hypothetical protein
MFLYKRKSHYWVRNKQQSSAKNSAQLQNHSSIDTSSQEKPEQNDDLSKRQKQLNRGVTL